MCVIVAPDSFKECLSAREAAEAMARGILNADPECDVVLLPMADGGEGTVDALLAAADGERVTVLITGPLGGPVEASYGLLDGGATAIIEMAAASGLALIPPGERDAGRATTRGTGELMAHALDHGVAQIIVGLGGSATTDGGAGMAQALGWRLLDGNGEELEPGGAALECLDRIDGANRHPRLGSCTVRVACDVTNPLCGPNGSARVYGPQKGASLEQVEQLDAALGQLAAVVKRDIGCDMAEMPGAGAAGGLGGGLVAFANGTLCAGFDLVAEACHLDDQLTGAHLVITGEGRMDGQTAMGKTIAGLAERATRKGIPVVAVAGSLGEGWETVYDRGVTAAFALGDKPMSLDTAMARAPELIEQCTESIMRLWKAAGTFHDTRI